MSSTRTYPPEPTAALADVQRLLPFRAALEEQRQFRLDQLAELAGVRRPVGEGDPRVAVTVALERSARVALADIDAALQRIDAGSYGKCTYCGDGISVERLEILPMVADCMSCARAWAEHERSGLGR